MDMKNSFALIILIIAVRDGHAGLRDSCTSDEFCKDATDGDANAICETVSQKCVCAPTYKENGNNDECVARALDDQCSGNANCADLDGAECSTEDKCACSSGFFTAGGTCVKIIGGTCTDVNNCADVEHSSCDQDISKCKCDDTYQEADNVCKLENGVGGLSANIRMLCSMLIMLGYLMKW